MAQGISTPNIREEMRPSAKRWLDELELAKKYFDDWTTKGVKIVERYRDEGDASKFKSRYNIFWASMEVMKPATFARIPKVECERRFKDSDPLGRVASQVLERATDYSLEAHQDFSDVAKAARDDWLLVGRAVLWERYVPYPQMQEQRVNLQIGGEPGQYVLSDGAPYEGEGEVLEDEQGPFVMEQFETLAYEESVTDYVFWRDFLHNPARSWNEVRWVARRAYMMRDELRARFADTYEAVDNIVLSHLPSEVQSDKKLTDAEKEEFKKAPVWEIWDKVTKKVYWVAEGCGDLLDSKPDPLKLKNFFPCPRPLYATTTNDSLIPRPIFSMASHQADEIDQLTERISVLTDALRVVGVTPADMPELMQVFKKDNTLVPIQSWTTFAERGGMDGIISWVPVEQVIKVLTQLYEAREIALQKFYEVTGWSDITRGATDPRETATAQGLKSQYASKRMQEKQEDMQRFLLDQIRIKAEIIAEHFQPETIRLMAGSDMLEDAADPMAFEQALQLLRQDTMRCFRVGIETDSTIALDEQAEKEKRTEFVETVTSFIGSAMPVVNETPALIPFVGKTLSFLARGFKAGRELESTLEQVFTQMSEQAQAEAQNPQPDPEMAKVQAQQQAEQVRAQSEQAKMQMAQGQAQMQVQIETAKFQLEQQKLALETEMKQTELALKNKEIELRALTEERKAEIKAATDIQLKGDEMRFQAMQMSAKAAGGDTESEGKSRKSPPINITIAQPSSKRRAVFRYDDEGNRVAEMSDVEEENGG